MDGTIFYEDNNVNVKTDSGITIYTSATLTVTSANLTINDSVLNYSDILFPGLEKDKKHVLLVLNAPKNSKLTSKLKNNKLFLCSDSLDNSTKIFDSITLALSMSEAEQDENSTPEIKIEKITENTKNPKSNGSDVIEQMILDDDYEEYNPVNTVERIFNIEKKPHFNPFDDPRRFEDAD